MPSLSTRTNTFTESLIRKMTRISLENNAINLSQGFPDFDPPKVLMDRLAEIAYEDYHQYAITWGSQRMREALAKKHEHFTGIKLNPNENILITSGSTEAMMCAMMTVCNIGDKVIVFSPFYENYGADAILTGSDPVYVPLNPPEFSFDPEVLEAAFKQHPKAIIVCNPSNPCGKVFTYDELKIIADFAEKYDTFVITDEVYEHIVYAPNKHIHFASLPGMFERTITCSSLSKTYSITGWRLGYILGPRDIVDVAKKVHDFLTVGAAHPLMEAVVAALELRDDYYKDFLNVYQGKKDIFVNGLKDLGLKYNDPQGAYYVLVDTSEFGVTDDVKFCEWLAKEVGVGAVPGSSFFREDVNNYIRLHFAKNDDTLYEALNRLSTLKNKATLAKGKF